MTQFDQIMILPAPQEISRNRGTFKVTPGVEIWLDVVCDEADYEAAKQIGAEMQGLFGYRPVISKSFHTGARNLIYLSRGCEIGESYRLEVTPDRILIRGGNGSGLFYGVQTLRQLLRGGPEIPCLTIYDTPEFKVRGYYHDITRGKVPKLETLMELVDRASFYKMNQLQLYVEHTFAFRRWPEIWRGADPITAEEILELDAYCRRRYIELVPSFSTFGHLYHPLATRTLRHLCELPVDDGVPFIWSDRMRHHTLDVSNPESITFVREMIDEVIPLFSSGKFNICGDETFDLGEGKSKELATLHGKARLYLDFLKQIITHVHNRGKEVLFWGDIVLQHPESLVEIPRGVVCLNWNYEPDVTEDGAREIATTGLRQYVCPGVQGWNRLINDIDKGWANIRRMVNYGKKYGVEGVLVTDWGDFGHINCLAGSIPGMIYTAALAWNPDGRDDVELSKEISVLEYGDRSGTLVDRLREATHYAWCDWGSIVFWSYEKTYGIRDPWYDSGKIWDYREDVLWEAHRRTDEFQKTILTYMTGVRPEVKQDLVEVLTALDGVLLFQGLLLVMKKYDFEQSVGKLPYEPKILAERLECWMDSYSGVWRKRNKESELYRIQETVFQICDWLRKI